MGGVTAPWAFDTAPTTVLACDDAAYNTALGGATTTAAKYAAAKAQSYCKSTAPTAWRGWLLGDLHNSITLPGVNTANGGARPGPTTGLAAAVAGPYYEKPDPASGSRLPPVYPAINPGPERNAHWCRSMVGWGLPWKWDWCTAPVTTTTPTPTAGDSVNANDCTDKP